MNPEKEIVNLWLNSQGFFTINDINAGKNRVIDMIAIKLSDSNNLVQHVEVNCSVSRGSFPVKEKRDLQKKFTDSNVEKKVKSVIKKHIGPEVKYEKVLITTNPDIELKDISVINFENVILDIVAKLDKQNYRNPVTRTMQLLKYTLMSNPKSMARLLQEEGEHKVLKKGSRGRFVNALLGHAMFKKPFSRESSEEMLIELLKYSSLKRPERLAEVLEKEILTKRAYNKFRESLLQQQSIKAEVKKEVSKKQQKLESYFA